MASFGTQTDTVPDGLMSPQGTVQHGTALVRGGLTLYHVPRTSSAPLVAVLHELQVPTDAVSVRTLSFADLRSDWFLRLNPLGTVPLLAGSDASGEFGIVEAGAILGFLLDLVENSAGPGSGCVLRPPSCSMASAKSHQLVAFATSTLFQLCSCTFLSTLSKETCDETKVAAARERFRGIVGPWLVGELGASEEFFLARYGGGGSPSAADFMLCKPLGNAEAMGWLEGEGLAPLASWLERMRARPSHAAAYS